MHAVFHGLLHAVDLLRRKATTHGGYQPVVAIASRVGLDLFAFTVDELHIAGDQAHVFGDRRFDTLDDVIL